MQCGAGAGKADAGAEGAVSEGHGGVRRLAFAGALTALAVAVAYLEQIPWLELQSLVVFAAGYLLGARAGALVGALAMAFYSAVNPYGLAHPLVFAAQIAGRALVGVGGGWAARAGLPRLAVARAGALAAWGVVGSAVFDLLTNAATGVVFGQMGPTLLLAVPFALGHLGSNAVLFVVAGAPLLAALEPRRAGLAALALGFAAGLMLSPAGAAAAPAVSDTVAAAPAVSDTVAAAVPGAPAAADSAALDAGTEPAAADTMAAAARDSLGRAIAAQVAGQARADSLAQLAVERAARAREALERFYAAGRWALALTPSELARRSPQSVDDALELLGTAPRFYLESGDVEPLLFAALPQGLGVGMTAAGPLLPRGTPWEEPGRIADGAALAWAWSGLPVAGYPEASDTSRGGPAWAADAPVTGRAPWASQPVGPGGPANFSSVWVGSATHRGSNQGFVLAARRELLGIEGGVRWSAWTKRSEMRGELGQGGSHGLLLGADALGSGWSAEAWHAAERVALADAFGFQGERRGGERTWARARWTGSGGVFAGLSAGRVEDRLRSEGLVLQPLWQRSSDLSVGVWGGATVGGGRFGARAAWLRERLAQSLGDAAYAPADLDIAYAGLFADGRAWGGTVSAALDAEFAESQARLLPRVTWERRASRELAWAASAGALSGTALGEPERVLAVEALPAVERPAAWVAQLGLRYDTGAPAREAPKIDGAPGEFIPGRLRGSLAAIAWSARDAVFPAYGLFARDVLLNPAVTADVDGVSLVGSLEWAPTAWAQLGATGYAAGRTLPAQTAMAAPDWRALVWGGPRLRLFSGGLELWLAVEADCVGQRLAPGEVLPAIVRPGARLTLGLGDAWFILRATDLDDGKHPLPGTRFDGEPLRSPGRLWRLYGEWRFLD